MLFTHNHCIGSRSMCGHQILRPVIGGFNYRHSQSTTAANSGFCSRKLLEIGGGVWLLGWGSAYDCRLCRWIQTNPEYRSLGDHAESVQMDGLRIPNKDLADLTPHFVWSKAEMLQLMKQMTKGRKDNLFLRKHCRHMMLAQPAQYVMEAGNKR
nr:uncharacterized protein LOC113701100 isoform X2 [Coffea arabica]